MFHIKKVYISGSASRRTYFLSSYLTREKMERKRNKRSELSITWHKLNIKIRFCLARDVYFKSLKIK